MKPTLLFFLIYTLSQTTYSQTSLQELQLENGTYTVGFNHYTAIDSTRTYIPKSDINATTVHRPIPISIWYPSDVTIENEQSLAILNYMEVLKEEEEWEHLPNYFLLDWFYYKNTPENQKHLKEKTTAFKDITPAKGNFPVIIYAASFQASSIENFALCELLASHGYIVIASPSRGSTSKRFKKLELAIETQARDLEFLVKEAAKVSNTDMNHIGTMGFSFGGLSNVLLQMRNTNIKANMSLDGTIRYRPDVIKGSPFYDIKKATIPFMHLAQKEIPKIIMEEKNIPDSLNTHFTFYDELITNDAYKIRLHDLSHSYFSTLGVLFQERDPKQDKSDPEIMASYKIATSYSLHFFNAYLKNNATSLAFITNTPQANHISEQLITIDSKKAQTSTFSFYDFLEQVRQQRYQNIHTLYVQSKSKYPMMEIPEGVLNTLGLQLIFDPSRATEGIAVFKFALQLYPTSANLYDSLAEGYLYLGDIENAKKSFKESLVLNPENQNAITRLQELE
ncbi:alpha/beta hydrolase [uncultured Dokdonia sp.]|uniref:alpha/beta hydrolase n=1 Tax=uncultured Dokdonia sp. TaxID=575653 RepID=UPI002605CB3C|nr:alpha/beta hydrolase [uncultured Dokdonia sp.]